MTTNQLALLPAPIVAADADTIEAMLQRGGLQDSTLKRYAGPARAWRMYCAERGEPEWDASTGALIRWLDSRVRERPSSPGSVLKISLAAARCVQRAHCAVHEVDALPYTPRARVQLDAFCRTATMNRALPAHARPLRLDQLHEVCEHVRTTVRPMPGVSMNRALDLAERDVALLIVGWWGALRSDDLARLRPEHVVVDVAGIELHMPHSKTTNASLALAARPDEPKLCPLKAFVRWDRLRATGTMWGLNSASRIGARMQTLFERAGLPRGYTGHSLRAGFATECASQGVPDMLVQKHGRWLTAQQHSEYVRTGRLWLDTPTSRVVIPWA